MSLFIFWLTREVVVGLKWLLLFDFVPAVCYVHGGSSPSVPASNL